MEWHNINEEDAASLNFLYPFIDVYPRHFKPRFGINAAVTVELKKDHVRYLLHESFVRQMPGLYTWLAGKKNFEKLESHVNAESEKLHRQSEAVRQKNLKRLTNVQLAREATLLSDALCSLIGWGLLPPLIDFAGEHISKAALAAIQTQVEKHRRAGHSAEYFVTLTTPCRDTPSRQEEREILSLASTYRRSGVKSTTSFEQLQEDLALYEATCRHAEKFAWTYFGYCGPAMNVKDAFEKARTLASDGKLEEKTSKRATELDRLARDQSTREAELALDANQAWAVHVARESVWLKIVRKDAMVHCAYALDGILREVAHRTHIPLAHVRTAKSDELAAVLDGTLTADDLHQRHACVVYSCDEKGTHLIQGPVALAFCEKELKPPDVTVQDSLSGQCAQPGKASGIVRIIDTAEQMNKMQHGDILVSIATTPEIVPVMKMASAIVTEIGGITSHAAIVSRELGVPCIIGTKVATKMFQDGDRVEVDATRGTVRKIP